VSSVQSGMTDPRDIIVIGASLGGLGLCQERSAKAAEADGHGMQVMMQTPDPLARMHTMTKKQGKCGTIEVKALVAEDEDLPA
jgi:hypothetical protein